jgi:AcrR family transcriptional regulator
MVESAASLIGSKGVAGTSFSDVISASGAPRGSIYHHFPGGKFQLAGDAMRWTKDQVLTYQRNCPSKTPDGVLDHFVDLFRQSMISSNCRAGCPVAGVLVDTYAEEDGLMQVGRESFRAWIALLAAQLHATGLTEREAESMATTALASVEGALILCRAEAGLEPLDRVNVELRAMALRKARVRGVRPTQRGKSPRSR